MQKAADKAKGLAAEVKERDERIAQLEGVLERAGVTEEDAQELRKRLAELEEAQLSESASYAQALEGVESACRDAERMVSEVSMGVGQVLALSRVVGGSIDILFLISCPSCVCCL